MATTTVRLPATDEIRLPLPFLHNLVTQAQTHRDPCVWLHDALLDLQLAWDAGQP